MKHIVIVCIAVLMTAVSYSCRQNADQDSKNEVDEVISERESPNTEEEAQQSEPSDEAVADSIILTEEEQIFADQYFYTTDGEKAAIEVRVGDVDNLGFGWDKGFDPFCGKNTSVHRYPWEVDSTDHAGTDRIMVVSGYRKSRNDGYTSSTLRAHTDPVQIVMNYDPPAVEISKLVLQMMLDDFQSPVFGSSFQFHINDKRLTYVEAIINNLNQTGPTGKLVQVGILAEDFELFESGSVRISIDDPVNDAGDGFAIDFIQLLFNPTSEYNCTGTIDGWVKDEQNNPLDGVLVSANGLKEAVTSADGSFSLTEVPVGMIIVSASKESYETGYENLELERDQLRQVTIILKKKEAEDENYVSEEILKKGFVNLYGILFDSGKDVPKEESEPVLNELANFVKNNDSLNIEIIGHTDSDGDFAYNEDLSRRRAQAVKNWLLEQDVDVSNIGADGRGESSPIASNNTDEGKALNRRVEVRVAQ